MSVGSESAENEYHNRMDLSGLSGVTSESQRLRGADGLRGIAMLIVVVGHSVAMNYHSTWDLMRGVPKIGVWLFFTLSAYLLTSRLIVQFKNIGMKSLPNYAIARFFRIIPLYMIAIVFYYFYGSVGINKPQDLMNAIFMQKGYAHLWTIPVELTFYCILPLIVLVYAFVFRFDKAMFFITLFMLLLLFFAQSIWPWQETPKNSINLGWYLSVFIFGSYSAVMRQYWEDFSVSREPQRSNIALLGAAISLLAVVIFTVLSKTYSSDPGEFLVNKQLFFGLLFGIAMYFIIDKNHIITNFLENTMLVRLGAWSYSIYLFHWGAIRFGKDIFPPFMSMIVGIGLSLLVGALLHQFIEKPLYRARWRVARLFLS